MQRLIYIFLSLFILSCVSKKREYNKEKINTLNVHKIDSTVFAKKDTVTLNLSELLKIDYHGGYLEIKKTHNGIIVKSDSARINYNKTTEKKQTIIKDSIKEKINTATEVRSKIVNDDLHKSKKDTSIFVYLSISILIAFFLYLYHKKSTS